MTVTALSLSASAMTSLFDPDVFAWGPIQRDPVLGKFRWITCATPSETAAAQLRDAQDRGYFVERIAHGRIIVAIR